ncbi:hypothetical protein DPMN_068275 [Dreissena polymorpha]|uniref:Uncharacterized protein n=1 Tax=Dreissena polymorpha TaxID=45954 RepID=A0A9D3Z1B0_DREPO|nr:hypothetical protein DPMN_068275 [Dreissena polymorpha]
MLQKSVTDRQTNRQTHRQTHKAQTIRDNKLYWTFTTKKEIFIERIGIVSHMAIAPRKKLQKTHLSRGLPDLAKAQSTNEALLTQAANDSVEKMVNSRKR